MDYYKYYMDAVDAQKARMRKAEALGNREEVKRCCESIARNLRNAAACAPAEAMRLIEEAERYEDPAAIPAAPAEPRAPAEAKSPREKNTPAPRRAPGPAPQRPAPPASAPVQGNLDLSGYDFGQGKLVTSAEKVTFDDIVGMQDVKETIRKELLDPLRFPEIYESYNLYPGGYTLLWGPPGTGKTTFARAVACEVDVPFVYVKCTDLFSSLLGETGHEISKLFAGVRKLAEDTKRPVVLFLDEIDAISRRRVAGAVSAEASVPTLLQELNGFDTSSRNIILIAATNVRETMDQAVLSRFKSIYVPLPDLETRRALFEMKMKAHHLRAEEFALLDLDGAARLSEGLDGRKIDEIVLELTQDLASQAAGAAQIPEGINERLMQCIKKRLAESAAKK